MSTGGNYGTIVTNDNDAHGIAINVGVRIYTEIRSLESGVNGTSAINLNPLASGFVANFFSYGNAANSVSVNSSVGGQYQWVFDNADVSESTKATGMPNFTNFMVSFQKMGNVLTTNENYTDGGSIKSNVSDRNTAADQSWEINPTSTNRQEGYPMQIREVCVRHLNSGSLASFTGAAKKTNAAITAQFRILGGRVGGVASDIVVPVTNTGTWNTYTTTFTPSENGVVEVVFEAWGGTTHQALCDDVDITQ